LQGKLLHLHDSAKGHTSEFVFDGVLDAAAGQEAVFQSVGAPLVAHVLAGFNACCFAYGQTGSGKTHSQFGKVGVGIEGVGGCKSCG